MKKNTNDIYKVKLLAKARFNDGEKGVYLVIKMQDMDGKNQTLLINAADAESSLKHVKRILIEHGFI